MQDQPFEKETLPPSAPPQRRSSRLPLAIVAGISALVLAAGGGTAWWTWHSISSRPVAPTAEPSPSTASPSPDATTTLPVEQTAQVYWLNDTGTALELVPVPIASSNSDQPQEILNLAFQQLLKGPEGTDVASTIPPGTTLQTLEVKADGIHVDLSTEFTSGGGSASMTGRLGQIIYTATSLDTRANVWISVDGQPLELLGGEGLEVGQPTNRADFNQNFSL